MQHFPNFLYIYEKSLLRLIKCKKSVFLREKNLIIKVFFCYFLPLKMIECIENLEHLNIITDLFCLTHFAVFCTFLNAFSAVIFGAKMFFLHRTSFSPNIFSVSGSNY